MRKSKKFCYVPFGHICHRFCNAKRPLSIQKQIPKVRGQGGIEGRGRGKREILSYLKNKMHGQI